MNAIRSVFVALGNLAASINGLAAILDDAGDRLQQQLGSESATQTAPGPSGREIVVSAPNGAADGQPIPSDVKRSRKVVS